MFAGVHEQDYNNFIWNIQYRFGDANLDLELFLKTRQHMFL